MKAAVKITIIILLSNLLITCSSSDNSYKHSNLFSNNVYKTELEPLIINKDVKQLSSLEISFDNLLTTACKYDSQISLYSMYFKKNIVHKEQASKVILPKINLELSASMPLDRKETDASDIFSGGFYLKYNILEALFYADAVSVSNSKAKKRNIQIKQQIKTIALKLYISIHELEIFEKQKKLYKEIYNLSEQLLKLEKNLKTSSIDSILSFEENLKDINNLQSENLFFLNKTKKSILKIIGQQNNKSILKITDMAEIIDEIKNELNKNFTIENSLQNTWLMNNNVELAKIDLFISEINLAKAKRSWYPQISASVGTGQLTYGSNNESSNIIISSRITMPILDWGNSDRIELLAKYDRDIMRINLIAMARKIINNLQDSKEKFEFSKMNYHYSKNKLNNAKNYYKIKENLLKTNHITPKELILAKISQLKSELNYNKTELNLLKNFINWKFTTEQLINKKDLMLIYKSCIIDKNKLKNNTNED